jgi:CelD/BcsL family acetyltransferase involved in cellulose biosynthesis
MQRVTPVSLDDLTLAQREEWIRCLAINPELTPFHSYPWLSSWATAYEARHLSFILISRNSTRDVLGLLPLMRSSSGVRSLSYNSSDYTGMIWRSDRGATSLALADYLTTMATIETVVLWNVRASDPLVGVLGSRNRLNLVNRSPVSAINLATARFRPWNLLARVSAREITRKQRRLAEADMRIVFAGTVDDPTLEEMVDVHTRSWERRGERGSFADPRRVTFVRELLQSRLPLFFAILYLGGRLVSYRFGPIDERTYYDWNTGTDPEYGRDSPGVVLLAALIDRMVLSERVHTIDFLRGSEDYKRAWITDAGWVSEYTVGQPPREQQPR